MRSKIEIERRNRIMVTLWAYAYEVMDETLVPDSVYDETCRRIDPTIKTGRLDDFFENEFDPSTGVWIHKHPEPRLVENLYFRMTGNQPRRISDYKNESPPIPAGNINKGSHFEMMCRLASWGFNVVGGRYIGDVVFDYHFDDKFVHCKCPESGLQKSVAFSELFGEAA